MPGGLLNLVSYGNQNIILNGNPKKTFFRSVYAKYTNFGLQKFRIDMNGQRKLQMSAQSMFEFKVPRYADLLMDTYLSIDLPHIWSPIYPPLCGNDVEANSPASTWQPYEFKWIENLGSQLIDNVKFKVGGQTIQEFSGQYLYNLVERDFNSNKKKLYYEMTGNVPELNDPANSDGRVNVYPSVAVGIGEEYDTLGPEPSIRGRRIYIPLNIWFTLSEKMAFPLVSLQYTPLTIEVTIRPINELYVVRYIGGKSNSDIAGYYHKPDLTNYIYGFHRYLQPPPDVNINEDIYTDKRDEWNADIHLIATYCFLSEDEVKTFSKDNQSYLIKQSYTKTYHNVVGTSKIDLKSIGLVSNWMWFLQRDDVIFRNEWSNYTNWPYKWKPYNVIDPNNSNTKPINCSGTLYYPNQNKDMSYSNIMISGNFSPMNKKSIMEKWALLLDGKYRENELDADILKYVEKYTKSNGYSDNELFCYNFCLKTDPADIQPSGALNTSKFNLVQFELTTTQPTLDPNAQYQTICDGEGNVIGTVKPFWSVYDYTYNLVVMEERYNILEFRSGMAGLKYSR